VFWSKRRRQQRPVTPALALKAARSDAFRLANGAFLLACVSGAGAMFWWASTMKQNSRADIKAAVLGVAASLLASAVFAIAQTFLTSHRFVRLVEDSVAGVSRDISSEVVGLLNHQARSYLPMTEYPETSGYDHTFNHDLSTSISQSRTYLFNGLTGKYVGPRLRNSHRLGSVTVIVGDPTSNGSVVAKVYQSDQKKIAPGADLTQFENTLRDDIDLCVAGLFSNRLKHDSIRLVLTALPALDRHEITDQALFISIFTENRREKLLYPQTLAFDPTTIWYQMAKQAARWVSEAPDAKKMEFTASLDAEQLRQRYEQVFGRPLSAVAFDELMRRYADFEKSFAEEAGLQ
jgi:hypothetical protein